MCIRMHPPFQGQYLIQTHQNNGGRLPYPISNFSRCARLWRAIGENFISYEIHPPYPHVCIYIEFWFNLMRVTQWRLIPESSAWDNGAVSPSNAIPSGQFCSCSVGAVQTFFFLFCAGLICGRWQSSPCFAVTISPFGDWRNRLARLTEIIRPENGLTRPTPGTTTEIK